MCFTTLAGHPTTSALAGTFFVTTAPAAIVACAPISKPGSKTAPAPTDTPERISVLGNDLGRTIERGNLSFVRVAYGPMTTSSSILNQSQTQTPHLILTPVQIT